MAWAGGPRAPKKERGYGYEFQKTRKNLLPSAYGTPCSRCGLPMLPGQKLHLDHADWDRTKLLGFSHAACNLRAAAKKARAIQLAAKMGKTRTGRPVHRW
jgi:hypothetical protein